MKDIAEGHRRKRHENQGQRLSIIRIVPVFLQKGGKPGKSRPSDLVAVSDTVNIKLRIHAKPFGKKRGTMHQEGDSQKDGLFFSSFPS